jgi:hypothetical protein
MNEEFKYTSGQYAKLLGISKEALRSRRRRGELESEYIVKNNICLYREPASKHSKKPAGSSRSPLASRSVVRQRRRGNHGTRSEKYGKNFSFQNYNELKQLRAIDKKYTEEEKQLLLKQAAKNEEREKHNRIKQLQQRPTKYYGGFVRGPVTPNIKHRSDWKELYPTGKDEYDKALDEIEIDYSKKYY